MLRRVILGLLVLVLLVPQSNAHQTVTATSSTGDVDTWGIMNNVPCHPDVPPLEIHPIHVDADVSASGLVQRVMEDTCLVQMCPADIYTFAVTLRLLNPSPVDHVAVTVVGEYPGFGSLAAGPSTYPTAVATYDEPVASVWVTLGGCNRATTAVVTGLVVEGEVDYELTF